MLPSQRGDVTHQIGRDRGAPGGEYVECGLQVATVFRAAEGRSDVAMFDTGGIEPGPVATVRLPHRVPAGFHGNWVTGAA